MRPGLTEALTRWQHAAGPYWPYVCAAPFLSTPEAEALAQSVRPKATGRGRGTALAASLLAAAGLPSPPEVPSLPAPLSLPRERRNPDETRRSSMTVESLGVCVGLPSPLDAGNGEVEGPRVRGGEGVGVRALTGAGGEGNSPSTQDPAPSTLVILVDLPPEPVLAAAPALVEQGWYVVPVVQRWISAPAVLPCRGVLARLLAGAAWAARPREPRGAVLIADGERKGPPGYPPEILGRAFDNRYEYQICRFPSAAFLKAQSVERLAWITPGTPEASGAIVAPDLLPYQEDLLLAGIRVDVVAWPASG